MYYEMEISTPNVYSIQAVNGDRHQIGPGSGHVFVSDGY